MTFSGKIEYGTSNETLNFGNDLWRWRRSVLSECFSSYFDVIMIIIAMETTLLPMLLPNLIKSI